MSPPPPWNLPKVSGEWWDLPLTDVLAEIAEQIGVSIVPPKDASTHLVTLTLSDVEGQKALHALGETLGLVPILSDGVVTFSAGGDERFVLMDPGYATAEELIDVVRGVAGSTSAVKQVGQRIAIVAPPASMERVAELERQLRTGADGWELSVVVFNVSKGYAKQLGIGATLSGRASLGLSLNSEGLASGAPLVGSVVAAVDALFRAAESERNASVVIHGSLFVLEGEATRMQQGDLVPVPRRTVSDQGTVTVTGVDTIESGFTLEVAARRVPDGVMLKLSPTLSTVVGFVEGYPILSSRSVDASAVLASGDWLIISGLDSLTESTDRIGLPGVDWLKSRDSSRDESTLVLAVRAVRVYAAGGA